MATVTLSKATIIEDPQIGTIVGYIGITGEDATENATYRLIDPGSGRFEIKTFAQEGILNWVLVVKNNVTSDGRSLFDFEDEALNSFTFKIAATGDKITDIIAETTLTVTVTDNEAPIDLFLSNASVAENSETGTVVGYVWGLDPNDDDDVLTYTLTDDAGGRFAIVDDALVVKDGALLDYESAKSHQITIEVKDLEGNVLTKTLTIAVSDVAEVRSVIATNDQPVSLVITGKSGKDTLYGSADNDIINGLGGNDKLYGLAGDDTLNGGSGKDILFGGDGADTFVFETSFKKGHFDQIRDFKSGEDKILIDLDALKGFKVKASKNDLLDFAKKGASGKKSSVGLDKVFKEGKLEKKFFTVGAASKDGNDYLVYNKKNGMVYLDADGSGGAKPIEILKLKPGAALAFSDFLFV